MRFIPGILFSMRTKLVLLGLLVLSVAAATVIEKDQGTAVARTLVYRTAWFEALFALVLVNLAGNLVRSRLWARKRYAALLLHLSFFVILLGAAVTRHFGREGTLHLREGAAEDGVRTDDLRLRAETLSGSGPARIVKRLETTPGGARTFRVSLPLDSGGSAVIRLVRFLPAAEPGVEPDPEGRPAASLMVSGPGGDARRLILFEGESEQAYGVRFSFGAAPADSLPGVMLRRDPQGLSFTGTEETRTLSMRGKRSSFSLEPGKHAPLVPGMMHAMGPVRFALQQWIPAARAVALAPEDGTGRTGDLPSAVELSLEARGTMTPVTLFEDGTGEAWTAVLAAGTRLRLGFGPAVERLPFRLALDDFRVDRYPGSPMPSGYRSEVRILDSAAAPVPYSIYMNHILKHRGYRFYQTDYDPDEAGTVLTVRRDPGTPVTYAGYALLAAGLLLSLFSPDGRFRRLGSAVSGLDRKAAALVLAAALASSGNLTAQTAALDSGRDKGLEKHLESFDRLLVQNAKGRLLPFSAYAADWSRRMGYPDSKTGLDARKTLWLSAFRPGSTNGIPLVPVEDPALRRALGLAPDAASVSWSQITGSGLPGRLEALGASAGEGFEESIRGILDRIALLGEIRSGGGLKVIPPAGREGAWVSMHAAVSGASGRSAPADGREIASAYFSAVERGDWAAANAVVERLAGLQAVQAGSSVVSRARLEAVYWGLDPFRRASAPLLWAGLAWLAGGLILRFAGKRPDERVETALSCLAWAGSALLTLGLALRWGASGHAPWTNKYESMTFISWAVLLAGNLFSHGERRAVALGMLLSGAVLSFAHSGFADPAIGLLAPVLKSKWLIIHVSVITASYGFFFVAAGLALLILGLHPFLGPKGAGPLGRDVLRLALVQERLLWVGLVLVTTGNLFGAVWANESWGRYWGWDPKESWTLIVILCYTAALHVRHIPGGRKPYWLSVLSLVGISSVAMTYFGVNALLSGMHSYARGRGAGIPACVWIAAAALVALAAAAFPKRGLPPDRPM